MVPTNLKTDSFSTEAAAAAEVPAQQARSPRRMVGTMRLRSLIAALLLGLVAPLVVAATPAQAVRSRSAAEVQIQKAVLKLMNQQRHKHHLKALKMNKKLQVSSRRHNEQMARRNSMSHQLPGEAFFSKRMSKAGYNWSWAGENIAWNSSITTNGVLALQKTMYNERAPYDGHRKNILSTRFRDVGIDVYIDRKHHKIWLTTDFGRKR